MTWTNKEYEELIEFKDGQIKLAFWFAAIAGCLIGVAIGKWII